ncbi:hypothetical protein GYMLUDRAFT_262386 [Collybiopsis luxurians FD-317 M1]|uniref:Protein kinase domain-containing protein n=1 Tax=Collybiopsis luxurians FD-317 M1 TaxID=944289 RepID=A0A0D0C7V3_9AGAR|nr:hypothetical protein GYMLUDRAFT_262386 [Collybiopsis luxurians FD-317 M1]
MAVCRKSIFKLLLVGIIPLVLIVTTSRAAPTSFDLERRGDNDELAKMRAQMLPKELDRDWILNFYGHSGLSDEDRKAFDRNLQVSIGRTHTTSAKGNYNDGVAILAEDYKGHKRSLVIAKSLKAVDEKAWAETKALKILAPDLFIDSGMVSGWPEPKAKGPVLLMKKVAGQILYESANYRNTNAEKQQKLLKDAEKMVCDQVVTWAVEKRILYVDFHAGNVRFVMHWLKQNPSIISMRIIDFGYPGLFEVKETVSEKDVILAATVTAALAIPGAIYLRRKKNVSFPTRSVAPRRQSAASTLVPIRSINSVPNATFTSPVDSVPRFKNKRGSAESGPGLDFSPTLYALRALGIATAVVSVGAMAAFWVAKTATNINDTQEFERRMRQFMLTRMPLLSSRIHRILEEEEASDRPGTSAVDLTNWKWEDAEKRLRDVYEKEGVAAWMELAVRELHAEERVDRLKRKELEDDARRKV